VCASCGEVADLEQVDAHPGPGMPVDRAERMEARLAGR
jgi:hypothetical protein